MEEERRKQDPEAAYTDIDKFDLSKTFPSVVYLESGTLYLQGCQTYIEYLLPDDLLEAR